VQIVCESCGATGAAASVEVVDGAVQLVCASCGHANVAGGAPSQPAPDPAGAASAEPDPPVLDVGLAMAAAAPSAPADAGPADAHAPDASTAAEAPEPADVADLPPVKCPKCAHRQYDEHACHRCGLVFAMVDASDRPWERLEPHQEARAPEARTLWSAVEATPGDASVHVAFVDYCRQNDLLGFAARQYRHWMADHPNDALSRSYLDRVVHDAQALVHAMSVGDDPFLAKARRLRNGMLVVVAVFCVVAMVWLVRTMAARGSLVP